MKGKTDVTAKLTETLKMPFLISLLNFPYQTLLAFS